MALPSPTTIFLHSVFEGIGHENMNNFPFTAIKLGEGEEEDVFATAFGKVQFDFWNETRLD
jgi:hypothetical protein